jgi:DNA-binding PadR family transcriptional regulator
VRKIPLKTRSSNWECVAFIIIYNFLISTGRQFTRSSLMNSENIDKAVKWLYRLNHKEYPEHPEATLQRTLQNLRDKGYIIFHGQGKYELTEDGISECYNVVSELNDQLCNIEETIERIRDEWQSERLEEVKKQLQNMSPEEIDNLIKNT